MPPKKRLNHPSPPSPHFGHAVVIGSSIAGLTAARTLLDHFEQVTLVERDQLPAAPEFRAGVPQARHAHTLPLRGQKILEQQFPGLVDELLANGAVAIDAGHEMAFYLAGKWHEVRHHANIFSLTCSRPLLDTTLYRRLAAHPRLRVWSGCEVVKLTTAENRQRVTGVRLHHRSKAEPGSTHLAADLVVDASGRGSAAPQWLAGLGYPPPQETVVNSFAGYASRIYRRPAGFTGRWKTMYIRPTPAHGTRGGLIIPLEGDRWHVTLFGMARDYPPIDEEGFLTFARSLPAAQFYEAISQAEPLTKPCGYRRTENRVRHYDRLARYLEGFLVCGDAVYTLNPVYAQGITVAALSSQTLRRCLEEQRRETGTLAGLAERFQGQLSQVAAGPWQMATREDQRWPATETYELPAALPGLGFAPGRTRTITDQVQMV